MKITLDQPHTHAGQPYQAGDTLDIDESDANWLISAGIAHEAGYSDTAINPPLTTATDPDDEV